MYKFKITIDKTKVSGSLTNFPYLFSELTASIPAGFWSHVVDLNGLDIRFCDTDEVTELKREIVVFNSGTNKVEAWVQIPTLSDSVDKEIWCHYGGSTAVNSTEVWSDLGYKGIYHLQVNGDDSTEVNDATLVGGPISYESVKINNGLNTLSSGFLDAGDDPSVRLGHTGSLEAWCQVNAASASNVIFGKNDWSVVSPGFVLDDYSGQLLLLLGGSSGYNLCGSTGTLYRYVRIHVVANWDGSFLRIYVNGNLDCTPVAQTLDPASNNALNLWLGCSYGRVDFNFEGTLDEMRLGTTPQNSGWISTDYKNQNDPATFASAGPESTVSLVAGFSYIKALTRIVSHAGFQPNYTASFTDTSTGDFPIVSWNWDQDGVPFSSLQNPTILSLSLDYHDITLTITDSLGNTASTTITINCCFIDWGAVPVDESDAFELIFTDYSTPASTTWDWDWGDSTAHGTTANPTHRYAAEGTYTVTLTTDNGLLSKTVQIVDTTSTRTLLAGGYDRDVGHTKFGVIYRSMNIGAAWAQVYSSFANTNVESICSLSNTILLAQTNTGNILKSINGGVNWSDLGTLIAPTASGDLLYLGNNVVIALTGNDYIDRSTDGGGSWIQVSIPYLVTNSSVTSKGVSLSAGRAVITSDADDGVLLSTDYGLTWSLVNLGNVVLKFRKFTDDIVVGLSYAGGGGWQNLLRSYDSGAIWAIIDDDMIAGSSYTGLGVTLPMGDVLFGRGPNGSATKCNYRQPYLSRSFLTATGTTSTPELFWSKNGKLFAAANNATQRGVFVSADRGQSFSVSLLSPFDNLHLYIDTFAEVDASSVTADFSGVPLSGAANLAVQFTDLSTGATSWLWDFGDGTAYSTIQNPTHTYTVSGIYTIILSINGGAASETKTDYITVNLSADFVADTTIGRLPLSVAFADQTAGSPTSWDWNFGDGTSHSTNKNPTHIYINPGFYTVTLTAYRGSLSDTETKVGYILVLSPDTVLATEDIAITESRRDIRMMYGSSTANYLLIKNGIRVLIPRSTGTPAGGGFSRSQGPAIVFD